MLNRQNKNSDFLLIRANERSSFCFKISLQFQYLGSKIITFLRDIKLSLLVSHMWYHALAY